MSLHKFAEQVAANGRGDDSLLVHMTPDEVRKLQQFAEANGTTLTINPETGLPEAGLLSDLFKTVAPIALGAFLGPAGAAFGGGLMSAGMAGLTVGGLTTLATGSLSRGLMAGLGAYGGAGLGEGLMSAGATGAASEAAAQAAAQQQLSAANMALGEAMPAQAAEQFTKDAVARSTAPMAKLGAGLESITSSPKSALAFAKDNWKPLAAAAAPIMAGAMVPTTTKMPAETNPAYIRQKLYDPYTQTYKSLAPVKASEWGNRNFSDAYTNPQTGQMATLDVRKPTGMAGGGIVALAGGGDVQHFAIGDLVKADIDKAYAAGDYAKVNELAQANKITAADVADTYKGFDTSGLAGLGINLYAPPTQQAAAAAPAYNQYTNEQIGSYLTTNPNVDLATAIKTTNADPAAVNAYIASLDNSFRGSTETERGSGTLGIYNQMKAQGIDPNELYAASTALDPKYAGWSAADIAKGYNLDKGMYALSDAKKGVVTDTDWAKLMVGNGTWDNPQYSVNDMAQAAGLSKAEVRARFELEKLKANPVTKVIDNTKLTGTGTDVVTPPPFTSVTPTGFYGNDTGNPLTSTPGDIIRNPDGTATVVPNIPGRPTGGFTGIQQLKDAYTAGGGSLGYKSPAPRTIAEFNQLYNKQTGDSLAAYDYLMGKGAGTAEAAKYPIQSKAAATGINRPYWTDTMRYKPKFLSYGKDGEIKSSTTSGKTADEKAADLTKAKTIEVVDSSGYDTQTYTAVLQEDGTYLAGNGKRYDVTGKELAADGGMMGYAMGGGLGSLGAYSDGGRLLKGPGDGVSDSIPATIGAKRQPARLADGEFVIPARIVSELGNGSTEAGAKKLYAMMDRVQKARGKTTGKNKVAANSRADKYLPA